LDCRKDKTGGCTMKDLNWKEISLDLANETKRVMDENDGY